MLNTHSIIKFADVNHVCGIVNNGESQGYECHLLLKIQM